MIDLELLKRLSDASGGSGNEEEVRTILKEEINKVTEAKIDGIGNVFGSIGHGPRVLAVGHMDEVGFMVRAIDNDGKIRFSNVGFVFNVGITCQLVSIVTSTGKKVDGVVAHSHGTGMKEYPPIDKLWIDIGASSKDEVLNEGIEVGNSIIWKNNFKEFRNNLLIGKAWDNRIGCAISVKALQEVKNSSLKVTFIGGGTVQEEVGCRGARALGISVKPDIAFSLDTAPCFDEEGSEIGKGPQIFVMDSGVIAHKKLLEYVKKIAKENNIPYQLCLLGRGGTDASEFQNISGGCPSVCIGIPVKYIHSPTSMISYSDYENGVKLLVKILESLDEQKIEEIKSF